LLPVPFVKPGTDAGSAGCLMRPALPVAHSIPRSRGKRHATGDDHQSHSATPREPTTGRHHRVRRRRTPPGRSPRPRC